MSFQEPMTEGGPVRHLLRFAVFVMIGDLVQQVYTIADSMVVGRLIGVGAFAAVSAAGSFYWFILVILFGISRGFATLLAQYYGAGNGALLRRACALSLGAALIMGAFLTGLCLLAARPALVLLRTPGEILEDTARYLEILLAGLTVTFVNGVTASALRALGDNRIPLAAWIGSSILNIILDILLVRLSPLGVGGVALATVAAQSCSGIFLLWYLLRRTPLAFRREDWVLDRTTIKELLRLGLPWGLQDAAAAVGGIVIQYVINGYGPAFIAGVAGAKRLYSLLFIISGGLSGAVAVFTAQNYGAGRFDRIRQGIVLARRLMFAGLVVIIPLMAMGGRSFLGLLVSGAEGEIRTVLDVAESQLRVCLILLPTLYLLFLYRAALQGMGNSFTPLLSGLMEAALRILAALILPRFLGRWGVYIAEPVGWPFMALQLFIAYRVFFKAAERPVPGKDAAPLSPAFPPNAPQGPCLPGGKQG
jgi:putative MATE family efflux protein